MPGHSPLPHELTDRIVDFVHNDQLALSMFSLAGRSFLPTVRYHRFSQVTLINRYERFIRLLEMSPSTSSYVSTLVLDSGLGGNSWRELHDAYAHNIFNKLPSLRFLVIRNFRVRSAMMGLLGHNTHLRNLSVLRCDLPSPEALARLVSSLRALERLCIGDLSFSENGPITVSAPRPQLNALGVMGLSSEAMERFCDWILDNEGGHGVQTFQTTVRSNPDTIATRYLIEKVGATLTEFAMEVDAEASLAGAMSDLK